MRRKSTLLTIILILVFIAGLSLLLYPTVSDYVNSLHQSKAIDAYTKSVETIDREVYAREWQAAAQYNRSIPMRENLYLLSEEEEELYNSLLDLTEDGVMGYIQIPALDVSLPIYHGTSEPVLQVAVGHLNWTSLPVGGSSSHCVISGHRGLPSATLFTDLDKLIVGDVFMLRVLNEDLTYQVDQIVIVEPDDTEELEIVPGEDLCTLVTCTPYGVNTHRLLVRGHRVPNAERVIILRLSADCVQIEPAITAMAMGIPLLLIILVIELTYYGIIKKKTPSAKEENT